MANERITEDIVRTHFKEDVLFKSIKWEEQKSNIKRVQELLRGESKGGGKGNGYPEFILSFPTNSSYLIVVECKAKVSDHESKDRNSPVKYAVDGVLHYAKALSKEFNVIAIAVSGQNDIELKVSHFYWKKGATTGHTIDDCKLLAIDDYMQVFDDQFFISDFFTRDIAYKAQYLNEEFNNYTIPEYKRCTMISAMLLALISEHFQNSFEAESTSKALGQSILSAINAVFESEKDMVRSKTVLMREFETILNEPIFTQNKIKNKKAKKEENTLTVLKEFITYLKKYVYPLISHSNIGYDVLGRFYIEFIRYAASEQKSGLVLTPAHVTELFCDLGEITTNDIVYDPCCGTGGFLVAAMQRMFKLAGNDLRLREHIRRYQLCGCELRSDIFTYACSSMRFRGDGKSNIYNGSCFNNARSIADNHRPTVAFLNPPYDVGTAGQMEFIEHSLSVLNPQANGRVVAIVQMSCATKDETDLKDVKSRLLSRHHLKAVISMPDDLFYPVGVVTCIMVFEANKPNAGKKTWFGYFKDDGFEKRKYIGRIDAKDRYTALKERLLSAYNNMDVVPGLSVRCEVNAQDEWCAEAYMQTDYTTLTESDFDVKMREYCAFKLLSKMD
jgi:type I restriction-modification system DNA methylase subunit